MADKPIDGEQVVSKDLFDNTIQSGEKLLVVIKDLEKEIKKLSKTQIDAAKQQKSSIDNSEELNKRIESINNLKKVNVNLSKVQQDRLKLENQLATLRTDSIQGNERLKIQLSEQRKANKDLAREQLGLNSEYEIQSKRLNKLRKDYKNLILSEGKVTKETKKLLKEVKKLDKELKDLDATVGQNQREVGNYAKALDDTTASLKNYAIAAGAAAISTVGVASALNEAEEGSEDLRKVTAGASGAFSTFKNTAASTILDLVDFVKAVSNGEKSITDIGEAFERTAKNTENYEKKLKAAVAAEINATTQAIAFEKAVRPLEISIAKLNGRIQEQLILAGDSTRSFAAISASIVEGQALQIERAEILFSIAEQEIKIIRTRLKEREKAGLNNIALLDQEKEAVIKLQEARNELTASISENEKELNQIKQDRLERDLDILIDGFDNQKTINERIIANERETLEDREELLERTFALADASFNAQKDVLADLSNAGINVDELLNLDAIELQKRIRELEQSEIIEGRTLEVVRERRIVLQDLAELQQELNDQSQEALDIAKDIQEQEQALEGVTTETLKELAKDREQNAIDSLRRRLLLVEQGSIEELRLEQELNDKLLELDEQRLEKDKSISEKKLAESQAFFNELASQTQASFDRLAAIENQSIEQSLDENRRQLSRQEELADKGLENELAFRERRQAELELQQRDALEKQQRREEALRLAETFFNFLNTRLQAPDANANTAAIQALKDTFLAKGLSKLLTLKDGTDFVEGPGSERSDSIPAMLSKGEAVIPAAKNREHRGLSQSIIDGSFDDKYVARSMFSESMATVSPTKTVELGQNGLIIKQNEDIKDLLQGIKDKPVQHVAVDDMMNMMETIYEGGQKTTIKHLNKNRHKFG